MNIHFQKLALVLTFTLILLPAPTFAIDWGEGIPNFQPSRPLLNGQGQHAAWEAVGRLTVEGGMDCTGALLDTRQTGAPSDAPAYVLTAGHCTHALNDPLSIIHDVDAEGSITFNYFEDTQAQRKVFKVKRITWSTLRGLDISIIELVPGLDTVIKSGIPPLKLKTGPSPAQLPMLVVGAPLAHQGAEGYLRMSACIEQPSAAVVEHIWVWVNERSNGCHDIYSGISGSPMLDRYTNEIIGVINTSTWGGKLSRCSFNDPCEVENGVINKKTNTSYGSSTQGLTECFSAGRFTVDSVNCPLGAPTTFVLGDEPPLGFIKGGDGPWQWKQTFSVNAPGVRYKYVRSATDCAALENYSDAIPATGLVTISNSMTQGPGITFLCVLPLETLIGPVRPNFSNSVVIFYRWLINQPPLIPPQYTRTYHSETRTHKFVLEDVTPDLDITAYRYKFGEPAQLNCDSDEDYISINPRFPIFEVEVDSQPAVVCIAGKDRVGQESPRTWLHLAPAVPPARPLASTGQ
ncbi:MAG: putative lipoprotein [Pseudomonas orientalis]|nr:putative lipoprotein [Pseudomonas orientalis]